MTNPAHAGKLQYASSLPKGMFVFLCYSTLLLVGNLNSGDRTNYELSSSWEVKDWIETFSRGRGPNSPALYEILCSIAHCASTPTGFLSNG